MAFFETVGDVRELYKSRYRKESYEQWLEEMLVEYQPFIVGYSQRRKELNKLIGLSETAGWDETLRAVKELVDDSMTFARAAKDDAP